MLQVMETFRFEDENDYEYEISFKVFSLKNVHPGILHCFFFSPDKLELLSFLLVFA